MRATDASYRWSDAALDSMRLRGDPAADAVVRAIFEDGQVAAVNRLIVTLVRNDAPPPEELPAVAREYFAASASLPPWADRARIGRASAFFGRHASRAMLILGHYSLPACYAARRGVQVLHMTSRLSRNPRPRLLETAQLVFDVMAPGGLEPGGIGVRSAQKVRLMHAAVRHLILEHGWDHALGLPVNQEDMVGTLLTFSAVILDGLRKLGFSVSDEDADAYVHAWNVVGVLMGVDESLLPGDAAEAGLMLVNIQRRHFEPCPEGRQLTAALTEILVESNRGTPFAGMSVSMMRFFLGDNTADMLGIPPSDWTRELVAPLRLLGWLTGESHGRLPLLARASESFGCALVEGLLSMERAGRRAEFRLPEALGSVRRGGSEGAL
ncbi:MAG: hypothetical protein RLZZ387_1040 [Chloroflexota bacterium]|jgi:hypothetical protein